MVTRKEIEDMILSGDCVDVPHITYKRPIVKNNLPIESFIESPINTINSCRYCGCELIKDNQFKSYYEQSISICRDCAYAVPNGEPIEDRTANHLLTPQSRTSQYCYKFNDECREHNREKYDRLCWLCGCNEIDNGKRLSVHHIDLNKNQGCNGHDWRLIPLCASCHGGAHSKVMCARIAYIYGNNQSVRDAS